jgi:6-pyruvoyltetrahydropterin/6-carboxytetrahydropterin synthase
MGFEVTTVREFSASHQLRLYDGSMEPLHGHNWRVKVTVGSDGLDTMGVVMDFHELTGQLEKIVARFHNGHLNAVTPFDAINPSAENVALHVGRNLTLKAGIRLVSVEVWETADNSAVWRNTSGRGSVVSEL